MDSESSTTQSESEIRDEEDQRESIDADDEGTYEGNPTETFRLCRPTQQFNLGNVHILRYHFWGLSRPPPPLYYQGLLFG